MKQEMQRRLDDLKQMQALNFEGKISMTISRISEWYHHWKGKVCVSISGKDSTVLLHIARSVFPDIKAVFCDTGLEYPEVRELAMSHENVDIIRPTKPFWKVIIDEGYPLISKETSECINNARKHLCGGGTTSITEKYVDLENMPQRVKKILGTLTKRNSPDKSMFNKKKYKPLLDVPFKISNRCCYIMKKEPLKKYMKETGLKPMTGEMAQESQLRTQAWLKNGCNGFDMKEPKSMPMAFWTEQDVLKYIKKYNVKIPSVYGEVINDTKWENTEQICMDEIECPLKTSGCSRTGCIYCGFGFHLEKGKTRFQRLKETHPKLYNYCMNGGEFNDKGVWQPNREGLGLKFVFDTINSIYGKDFYRYE